MHKKWLLAAGVVALIVACQDAPPTGVRLTPGPPAAAVSGDPALASALSTASPTDQLQVIVTYDEVATTQDALANSVRGVGASVLGFENLPMVAALATPAQIQSIQSLAGVDGVYFNKSLRYLLVESIPAIHADGVHIAGITGTGVGVAILDSGVDGLYNQDLVYPTHTVANVKYLANVKDIYTDPGSINKGLRKGASIFLENLPNTETSIGHGTHVAGIVAATGASSAGKYTGVAPGANIIGIGTGDGPVILWVLAGFDYTIKHRRQYNS